MELLFLLLLIFIAAPIGITYVLYRHINLRYPGKAYKYVAFIPILIWSYFIWEAFYPPEDFYKEDYKQVTQLNFPEKAVFLYKFASFPDYFGDYTSVFLIQIESKEYTRLMNHLPTARFLTVNNDSRPTPETNTALAKTPATILRAFSYEKESKRFYVALFNDHQTVLVKRQSW